MGFEWDDPELLDPVSVMLYGGPKRGKTHWAVFGMPEPVFLVDTENRAGLVVKKARAEGKSVFVKRCQNLQDVRFAIIETLKNAEGDSPGTFVFDTASDLQHWAEEEYLQESKADKIYPKVVWAKVYRKIEKLITVLQQRGFFIVFLCRERDEYSGEDKTGAVIHDGYKRLPYRSDVVLRHRGDHLRVYASGLARTFPAKVDPDLPWTGLYELLVKGKEEKDG